jgi:hypothetical protein
VPSDGAQRTNKKVSYDSSHRDEETADEKSRQPIPADPFQNFI